jgi:hypothetical protein
LILPKKKTSTRWDFGFLFGSGTLVNEMVMEVFSEESKNIYNLSDGLGTFSKVNKLMIFWTISAIQLKVKG